MFQIIQPLGSLLKIKRIITSDVFFLINTKLTVTILLLSSVILSTTELFGTVIDCNNGDLNLKRIIDNFCWSTGTYIPRTVFNGKTNGIFQSLGTYVREDEKVYQLYYQWINLILVIQAIICYLPAYLWKSCEGGLLQSLCQNLEPFMVSESWPEQKRRLLAYFGNKFSSQTNTKYAYRYGLCKLLSLLSIIINITMLHMIIPGFWENYGMAIYALFTGNKTDWRLYSEYVFPRLAKCLYQNYGPSGSIEEKDSLCLLPLNVLNEKIFVILWLWYSVLLIVSLINFLYHMLVFASKNLRISILKYRTNRHLSKKQIQLVTNNANVGDFFVINQMAKNVNSFTFLELMLELAEDKRAESKNIDNITFS